MNFRNRYFVNALGWSVARLCRLWMGTVRLHIEADDRSLDPRSGARGNIYCMWHENMFYLGYLFADRQVNVLISRSADGEYITSVMEHLGYKTVRGSTNRGGMRAAREIIQNLAGSNLSITPDGPRGPRREFQDGAVFLASRTGMPLVAVGMAYDRPWRLKTWDRLALPRPFSKAVLCSTHALHVPPDADEQVLQEHRRKIAFLMTEMNAKADNLVARWSHGEKLPVVSPEARAATELSYRRSA